MCGLLAFVTVNIGWIAGGFAQPAAYSVANDDISDLGADTASSSWIYNRIGANLTGLLVMALALGLWRALSPDVLGRIGAGAVLVAGAGAALDGVFHLDCRGIDTGCTNDSWHSHAHKIESGITGAATIAAPLILAFAFRRIPAWRDSWLPSLLTVPAIVLANAVFSAIGNGAATRSGTVVAFLWIAFVSVRLPAARGPLGDELSVEARERRRHNPRGVPGHRHSCAGGRRLQVAVPVPRGALLVRPARQPRAAQPS